MSSALGNLISYFDGRDFLVRTFIVFCVKIFILCGVDNNLVRNLGCIWLVFEAYGEVSFTTHFGLMFYIYEMFDCSFSLSCGLDQFIHCVQQLYRISLFMA
eukprot:TRINITY_DN85577_c0_g1_i1.p1 TRINITY_DN85577_c0_g1~~TRINITY_DN85577_c0_g1_i1.p1  ORF type:complete len:101 (-),score=2.17 TRINITY_DN85577_c0_g1_i1:411-713(-)